MAKIFVNVCNGILVAWVAGLIWFVSMIPSVPANDTINTDAIVVLTGGSLRLERGFQMLIEGRAKKMFISGVENNVTLSSILRNEEYKSFAGKISPDSVTLGHKARSTIGNAEETAEWIEAEHITSVRLITGNYHMPRSIHEISLASPQVKIIPEPVFPIHFEHNDWWKFTDSIKLVLSEYNKYIATNIKTYLEHFIDDHTLGSV